MSCFNEFLFGLGTCLCVMWLVSRAPDPADVDFYTASLPRNFTLPSLRFFVCRLHEHRDQTDQTAADKRLIENSQ